MAESTYTEDNNSAWGVDGFLGYTNNPSQWVYFRIKRTQVIEHNSGGEIWTETNIQRWSYFYNLYWNYPSVTYNENTGNYELTGTSSPTTISGYRCISSGAGYIEGDQYSNNVTSIQLILNSDKSSCSEIYKNGQKAFQHYDYPPSTEYTAKYDDYTILEFDAGGFYADIPSENTWSYDSEAEVYTNNSLPEGMEFRSDDLPLPMWFLDPYRRLLNGLIPRPLISSEGYFPYERPEPISVYDVKEPQNGFTSNGLAILMPYECTSMKEEAGRWDITLKHPIDKYGKWTYIAGQNVLKINGQLFRIDQIELISDASKEYIQAHANHITYDLKDFWIQDAEFSVEDGYSYIGELWSHRVTDFPNQQHMIGDYQFTVTSDCEGHKDVKFSDQSYIEALYGSDNSLLHNYGGYLYRNNFYMSINKVQEYAPEGNAFSIRYGTNMTKISFKIDMSSWITNLVCVDNYENFYAQWYDTAGGEWICHHHKTKRVHFTYSSDLGADGLWRLIDDADAYWATVAVPQISIEVGVANIIDDPKYADFVNLQNFDVGYHGIVYVEHLGINVEMKINSIKRNELTGQAISIKLGSVRGSLIRQTVLSQTITNPNTVEGKNAANNMMMQAEIETAYTAIMAGSISGMESFSISDIEKRTINELEGGQ